MCGRFIFIRVYIDDEDNEGELKKLMMHGLILMELGIM